MELVISIIAIAISFVSIIVSIVIYQKGVQREKKEATLDAFNILQEQVFDYLNQYTYAQIRDICNEWQQAIKDNKNKRNGQVINLTEEQQAKRNKCFNEYRILSGYLARIEHFALGINTGIYDAKVAERAGTSYLVVLYRGKLKPLIETKHLGNSSTEYYAEFRRLIEKIEKIEK